MTFSFSQFNSNSRSNLNINIKFTLHSISIFKFQKIRFNHRGNVNSLNSYITSIIQKRWMVREQEKKISSKYDNNRDVNNGKEEEEEGERRFDVFI